MLSLRSSVVISLSGHFFLGLYLLCFKEGALGSDMPTQTAVMAYRRSFDGMRLLSA
jgi:purine-cytosine permease-like protein